MYTDVRKYTNMLLGRLQDGEDQELRQGREGTPEDEDAPFYQDR